LLGAFNIGARSEVCFQLFQNRLLVLNHGVKPYFTVVAQFVLLIRMQNDCSAHGLRAPVTGLQLRKAKRSAFSMIITEHLNIYALRDILRFAFSKAVHFQIVVGSLHLSMYNAIL